MQGAGLQSLVGELRSHIPPMPNGVAKKIIATKKTSIKKIFKEVQIIIFFFFFLIFIHLFACTGSSMWHMSSSSLTRDATQGLCIGNMES